MMRETRDQTTEAFGHAQIIVLTATSDSVIVTVSPILLSLNSPKIARWILRMLSEELTVSDSYFQGTSSQAGKVQNQRPNT